MVLVDFIILFHFDQIVLIYKCVYCRYDINQPLMWEETPLRMAIRCQSEICAMTLVHYGCNIQDKKQSYFKHAADEGLLRLCKLLLEIFPYFIYEDWVRNKHVPVALNKHTEFCEWLFSLSKDPRSLLHICKSKIFKCLGKFACLKLDKLPLPKMLIESLKYNHHFHERMYKPITLETDECPFDCSPRCRRPNCPRGIASFD